MESLKGLALSFFSKQAAATAPLEIPPGAVDDTNLLRRIKRKVREGRARPLPNRAELYSYRFIGGFAWDILPDYFEPNIERLRAHGLDASLVETDPYGTSKENAPRIKASIAASSKPIILFAHSKGGADSLEALRLFPELQDQVKILVLLQSPYFGTPLADWFAAHPWLYTAAVSCVRLLNPRHILSVNPFSRHETAQELSLDCRGHFCKRKSPLKKSLQIYSIASRVSASTSMGWLLRLASQAVRRLSGQDNDGLVAPEQAIVPGSRYALLEHVGHADMIASPKSWKHRALGVRGNYNPHYAADLTEAVVRWVLGRQGKGRP
jgi:hypothetical protein